MASEVTHILTCDIFSDQEFQHTVCTEKISKRKHRIFGKIQQFSCQQQFQIINLKLFKYYEEKDKNIFLTYLSSLEQEPTFKIFLIKQFLLALAILKAEALHQSY